MLIGIDASRAVTPAPTGTETYSQELIRALVALDQRNSYRLYTREPVSEEWFKGSEKIQVRVLRSPRLWTYARLAPEMLISPPDVLFVPAHVLPPVHPKRSLVTIHDLGHLYFPETYPTVKRLYHYWTTRWNAHAAIRVLADSEATRDDIVKFCHIEPSKISVVYPAFDARRYRPNGLSGSAASSALRFRIVRDYLLAIGTIHPRKNYLALIESFARLISESRFQNLDLVIVGKKGWLYQNIFDRARNMGLDNCVHFLDYVPAEDMPSLVAGARLLAFPSLHEGFGIPVLEAQACGTPVVCSMTSSFPESAGDGALFFDPQDKDAIYSAMARVLDDDNLRSKIIRNGFENVKRFSWEKSAKQLLEIIEGLE